MSGHHAGTTGWLAAIAAVAALAVPTAASGQVPASLKASCERADALDADLGNGVALPYFFCDDGVPATGGRDPNPGADLAMAVPQNYAGDTGLPAKAVAQPNSGADADGNIALDADLSFPNPAASPMPASGYPLVVFMHGCCGGDKTGWEADTIDEPASAEKWHYSNAWFASRGYAVLTYTARGFVNRDGEGSTGETQLDHRGYEINDYQYLSGLIAEDKFDLGGETVTVDPTRIVTTGGSYGGGFSWLALTDPSWRSPNDGIAMQLAASAPRYGWTDLVQSLVPNGQDRRDELLAFNGSESVEPLGFPKQSIVGGLYASGKTGTPTGFSHATFPSSIDQAAACAESFYDPVDSNPLCTETLQTTLPSFIADRSAYYQDAWFDRLAAGDSTATVPLFSAGTFTDPLFTTAEHRRMVERILSVDPDYPVQEYYGDYQHFTQNKRKEWSDLCGEEVCTYDDYPAGDLNADPAGLTRTGINTRLNRFLDHFVKPGANPGEPAPAQDVTAALQICPENATDRFPPDHPGPTFTADSFDLLAPNTLRIRLTGTQTTTSKAVPNTHAVHSDPVFNQLTNDNQCPVENGPAGAGVASYTSDPLARRYTMIGRTRIQAPYEATGSGRQLNGRLYDVFPDGRAVLVDRGALRIADGASDEGPRSAGAAVAVIDLFGAGWRFKLGHRIRVELAQDDAPFIKSSTQPSSMTVFGVRLLIPVRERVGPGGGPPDDEDPGGGGKREQDESGEQPGSGDGGGAAASDSPDGAGGTLPFSGLNLIALLLVACGSLIGGWTLRRTHGFGSPNRMNKRKTK